MILDTNAVSALAGRDPDLLRLPEAREPPVLSFVAVAGFRYGLLGSTRAEVGLRFLQELEAAVPILPPDREFLMQYSIAADALKRSGKPIPQNDMWTPALCLRHDRQVVSRDRHFDFVPGVLRIDW